MTEAMVVRCVTCGTEVPAAGQFCSACGGRLASDDLPTFSSPARSPRAPASRLGGPSAPRSGPPVPPGPIRPRHRARRPLPDRRACSAAAAWARSTAPTTSSSDQPVALKFLPEAVARRRRAGWSASATRCGSRARSRTRTSAASTTSARSTASRFLSMEYVDGEDLASLLRRIGRLPPDKALEIARQLCAGLAAAHEQGRPPPRPEARQRDARRPRQRADHRLRPGRRSRTQIAASDVRAARPAYMAPEQLEGREVTVRSDLYSLGLVLYEMFTGKRAFEGKTLAEAMRSRSDAAAESPSLLVRDLDPAVERSDPALPRARSGPASGVGAWRWPPRCPAAIRWPRRWPRARRRRRRWSPTPERRWA